MDGLNEVGRVKAILSADDFTVRRSSWVRLLSFDGMIYSLPEKDVSELPPFQGHHYHAEKLRLERDAYFHCSPNS